MPKNKGAKYRLLLRHKNGKNKMLWWLWRLSLVPWSKATKLVEFFRVIVRSEF